MGEVIRFREKLAERTNFGPIAATAVFSLFCKPLLKHEKIWPQLDGENAFAGASGGGSVTNTELSPSIKMR